MAVLPFLFAGFSFRPGQERQRKTLKNKKIYHIFLAFVPL